ncbi:MAG TPA: hypothetical protein VGF03_10135 [Bryobacteraceae bacterium]
MTDKAQALQQALSSVKGTAGELFGLDEERGQLTDVLRQIMDPKQVMVYDLALRCETEMLACERQQAYFSACLMGAAMNEALISLLCLLFEDRVTQTQRYSKAKQRETYALVVGRWSFEDLVCVADELYWIPDHIVAPEMMAPLAAVYRELMPISDPEMSAEEIDARAGKFTTRPGLAMLRLVQELRNSIHAGPWIRGQRVLNLTHFEGWCRIATRVSAEIRDCLFHVMVVEGMPKFNRQVAEFEEHISGIKERLASEGKDPDEVDGLVKKMLGEAIEQAKRDRAKR